jgi:hypothetical protein
MTLTQKIVAYLESLGKNAAKEFNVSPQKVAAWKKRPETVPFAVAETATEWAREQESLDAPQSPQSDLNGPELSRHNWGEELSETLSQESPAYVQAGYEPEQGLWDHVKNHQDRLYELNDRLKGTEDGIARILNLLQTGAGQQQPQPLQRSPTATTQRLEPVMGPNGELPAFVSSGPQQAATDNLTRPSRVAGQPMTEADLDLLDPTRHKPAVDPSTARALWMRPRVLPVRR